MNQDLISDLDFKDLIIANSYGAISLICNLFWVYDVTVLTNLILSNLVR